jgi:hypothetical protein
MNNIFKLTVATVALSLIMVGCTCSEQNTTDEVVPMEEPAAVPGEMPLEGAPAEGAPADAAPMGEELPEGHTEDDGHAH